MFEIEDYIHRGSVFGRLPVAPMGKGRPRLSARDGMPRVHTPAATKAWADTAAWYLKASRPGKPFAGPVEVALHFAFKRPESHFTKASRALVARAPAYHLQKPDLDNLEKMMLDCLVKAGIMVDDTQVVEMHSKKTWLIGSEFVRWVVTPILETP